MTDSNYSQLINAALEARAKAYSPYSNFPVGAALIAKDGTVFTGCNVENSSFGLCICAERSAICNAVSQGHQEFEAIAVAATPIASPCGACRQFLAEFGVDIQIIGVDALDTTNMKVWTLSELIPENFKISTIKTRSPEKPNLSSLPQKDHSNH